MLRISNSIGIRRHLNSKLLLGTAMATSAMLASSAAWSQNESVTVTGTSIRGQAPVGAAVITVDRAKIEATGAQTIQQLLVTIPQLNDFGSDGVGGGTAQGGVKPVIHSLGNSASDSTLVLIDGHRFMGTGGAGFAADPNVIPNIAIQSVEVLPDGASAIYGSDSVAGVINFHLRKEYSGWETSAQFGIADRYNSFSLSQLFGHGWDNGSVLAAYGYSNRSSLMNRDRDFITPRQDIRRGTANASLFTGLPAASTYGSSLQTVTVGGPGINSIVPGGIAVPYPSDGGNFQNFACPVAVIATSSNAATSAYAYPYAGTPALPRQTSPTGGPGTGICDTTNYASALPSEVRQQGLVSMRQSLNDRLSASVDIIYSARSTNNRSAVGAVTNAAVFNPDGTGGPSFGGNQRNPFWVDVPGAPANATSQFITMDFSQLLTTKLGYESASSKSRNDTAFVTLGLDYDLGGDWLASLGSTFGTDHSTTRARGSLNTAEALLALNGTVNTGGTANSSAGTSAYIDPYGLGTVVSVTRALTMANALDVWNPAATNRTSSSVLRSLVDSASFNSGTGAMQDVTFKADGPLGDFWGAGNIKAAFGGQYTHYVLNTRNALAGNIGPSSTSARTLVTNSNRTVYAAYAEFVVPLISPEMEVPLIRDLIFDMAGRYDHYNDFGSTKNPKIAFTWGIFDGLAASASMGTSFTAPQLANIGDAVTHRNAISGINANNSGAANNLVVLFNDTRPFNEGAGIAGTFVSNPYACAAAGSQPVTSAAGSTNATLVAGVWTNAVGCKIVNQNNSNSQGLTFASGSPFLKPQVGQTYSANLLFDNFGKFWDVLEGLRVQATYYQAKYSGAITNIGIITTQTNAGLPRLTTFSPANCTGSGAGTVCTPGWLPSDQIIQDLLIQAPLNNPMPARIYSIQDNRVQNAFSLWQNGLDFAIDYRVQTDAYGNFSVAVRGNQILRASQQNGPGGPIFDIKGGRNGGRFDNIEFTGNINITWQMDPVRVGLGINYQHPYNTGKTTFPFNLPGPGRLANQQHIGALITLDLNLGYDLPEEWLSGTSLSMNVSNLLDTDPPYENITNGLAGGSVIGRYITLGLRKKW